MGLRIATKSLFVRSFEWDGKLSDVSAMVGCTRFAFAFNSKGDSAGKHESKNRGGAARWMKYSSTDHSGELLAAGSKLEDGH